MKEFISLVLLFVALTRAAVATSSSNAIASRDLEEDNGDYDFNMKGYSVQAGTCFRVKIVNDNDDDGNSYFYNGAYRSQLNRYTSFYLCSNNSRDTCKLFVTDLETYLETSIEFVESYCTSCKKSCRRMRRDLEEQGGDWEAVAVDCDTCSKECKETFNNNNNNNYNAANYLECQESHSDGDLQYYSAPQCGSASSGHSIVIGTFYDDECTVKTSSESIGQYNYAIFDTLANMKINCGLNYEICADLADVSIYCDGDDNDDDDAKICKAAIQSSQNYSYYKKPWYKKVPLKAIFFVVIALSVIFSFLSYTYYVRHKRETAKIPMAALDETEAYKPPSNNDLPVIS